MNTQELKSLITERRKSLKEHLVNLPATLAGLSSQLQKAGEPEVGCCINLTQDKLEKVMSGEKLRLVSFDDTRISKRSAAVICAGKLYGIIALMDPEDVTPKMLGNTMLEHKLSRQSVGQLVRDKKTAVWYKVAPLLTLRKPIAFQAKTNTLPKYTFA